VGAPERQVRVTGARRERLNLRALADLIVAAADAQEDERPAPAHPTPVWRSRHENHNNSKRQPEQESKP
jgi:hypothetical protein